MPGRTVSNKLTVDLPRLARKENHLFAEALKLQSKLALRDQ
jgi:hypothetical protein